MSPIDQVDQTDSFAMMWKVLRAARFELTFVAGFAMLYLGIVLTRARARVKGRTTPKKERATTTLRTPSPRTEKTVYQRAGEKRDDHGGALEVRSALDARELDAVLQGMSTACVTDPAWLIPRVVDACHTDAPKALLVFRKAQRAGLNFAQTPESDCEKLFTALVTSMIRLNRHSDAKQLLQEMQAMGCAVTQNFRTSIVKLCTAKQAFNEALEFSDMFPNQILASKPEDKSAWSCLLFCAVEVKAYHRCRDLIARLKASGTPSQKDYWNMVRCGSAQGDWSAILRIVEEMREYNVEADNVIYNTALACCVAAGQVEHARRLLDQMEAIEGVTDVITYNTIMKGYAKGGKMEECLKLYELMQNHGHPPSPVTYGILLDGYINNNDVENAAKIFRTMQSAGCPMNTILYTTLIKGFAREGKVDDAMSLYNQMIGENGARPDLITYSTLLKANCDAGQLEQALGLLDNMMKAGLKPDEVIFNNLLAGCAVSSKVEVAKQIYSDMVARVKPSNATFSILIRLYTGSKLMDEAVTMLKTEPLQHNVTVETRLYVQLITSCIRTRQGRRAVDVCELMHERSTPTPALMSTVLSASTKLNMYDTAADLLACSAKYGGRVDARDANMVLLSARKKKKDACVESCLTSMRALGLAVDP